MGQGGLNGQKKQQFTSDYYGLVLSEETMRYVHRILAFKLLVGDPDTYGFHLNEEDVYEPIATRTVTVKQTIKNLAQFAVKNGTNLKTLKELNPWLRSQQLTVKNGKSYEIALPIG
jgi:hypothetical protein